MFVVERDHRGPVSSIVSGGWGGGGGDNALQVTASYVIYDFFQVTSKVRITF